MTNSESCPPVGIAHVGLETDRMEESAQFMRTIRMRPIFEGSPVSVFEMRSGTHLILALKDEVEVGEAPFDLMANGLRATHKQYKKLGLKPSAIEARLEIDHEIFTVQEPNGYEITIFSSHTSGKPI